MGTFILLPVGLVGFLKLRKLILNLSTFVCPTEIVAFSERSPEFAKLNCQVLANLKH
jgi:hypothetical protein